MFDLGSINTLCRGAGAAPVHERLAFISQHRANPALSIAVTKHTPRGRSGEVTIQGTSPSNQVECLSPQSAQVPRHVYSACDSGLGHFLQTLCGRELVEVAKHALRKKPTARSVDMAIAVTALLADEEA